MGLKRTDEFCQDAVRIALTSGLSRKASLLCGGTPPCGPMDKPKPNKLAQFYSGQIQPNSALSLRRSVQFWSGVDSSTHIRSYT